MRHATSEVPQPAHPRSRRASTRPKAGPTKRRRRDERTFALSLLRHPGDRVLDVGTGECTCVASVAADLGIRVVAIDRDEETIGYARTFVRTMRISRFVELVRDDITASTLPSESFRNAVCFNVLHHVPDLDRALVELRRILSADGRLVISDFDENRDGFLDRLQRAATLRFRRVTAYPRSRGGRLVLSCEP